MAELSAYEKERQKQIAINLQVLKDLGLSEPSAAIRAVGGIPKPVKPKETKKKEKKPTPYSEPTPVDLSKRRVTRSQSAPKEVPKEKTEGDKKPKDGASKSFVVEDEAEGVDNSQLGNVFGEIPGVEVGRVWDSRMECSKDKVHRPPVAGIHGSEMDGCYSIAMSGTGEYNDDLDWGDSFTYTGEGGRDLKGTKNNPKNLRTAIQSKDQTLTRGNLALSRNFYNRKPVRVIRGYKLGTNYAPAEGYRYDGLYTVEKYWETAGKSGHKVYKFALKRCPDQPVPWGVASDETADANTTEKKDEIKTEQ